VVLVGGGDHGGGVRRERSSLEEALDGGNPFVDGRDDRRLRSGGFRGIGGDDGDVHCERHALLAAQEVAEGMVNGRLRAIGSVIVAEGANLGEAGEGVADGEGGSDSRGQQCPTNGRLGDKGRPTPEGTAGPTKQNSSRDRRCALVSPNAGRFGLESG
jgi:hypothetical protein